MNQDKATFSMTHPQRYLYVPRDRDVSPSEQATLRNTKAWMQGAGAAPYPYKVRQAKLQNKDGFCLSDKNC